MRTSWPCWLKQVTEAREFVQSSASRAFSTQMETINQNVADFPETTYPMMSQANHQDKCQETETMKSEAQRSEVTCQKGTPEKTNRVYRLYSEGWQTGGRLPNRLQTEDKRRTLSKALRAVCSAFTWINDICRQTHTYSSASPQHNLAPRRSPCSTI